MLPIGTRARSALLLLAGTVLGCTKQTPPPDPRVTPAVIPPPPAGNTVKGTATYREKIAMPSDAVFEATLAAAKSEAKTDLKKALARLDRYREVCPDGAHVSESRDWQKRLRGEMPSLLDKTRELNDV